MLTKRQKVEQIEQAADIVKTSGGLLFADFYGVAVGDLNSLRRLLKSEGAKLKVVKKRLLKIALEKAGLDISSVKFGKQTGIIFIPKDILSIAGAVYKFGREMAAVKKAFKILGGYDRESEKIVTAEEFIVLAKLPNRETLLVQIAIALMMPVRQLAWALKGRGESLELISKK